MMYFVGVNYGSCDYIKEWLLSIRENIRDAFVLLVDNYKCNSERIRVRSICEEYNIELIEAENIGYGKALNLGISYCREKSNNLNDIIFAGNIDIRYRRLASELSVGRYVYVPRVYEKGKNKNPFLTRFQKRIARHQIHSARFRSKNMLYIIVLMTKCLKIIPSPIWTMHGSVFVFSMGCLNHKSIFNEKTFLYSEEMEFGSYMEEVDVMFINADIVVDHIGHVSTRKISDEERFMNYWIASIQNWYKRWR